MSKEGKKNRKTQIYVVLISSAVIIVTTLLTLFNNAADSSNKNEGVIDNSKLEQNNGTLNKTNVGNNSGTVIGNQTNNNYDVIQNKNVGYSIKGSKSLLLYLINSKKVDVNQKSNYTIEVSYTGNIVKLDEDSNICQYNGGNIKITVNDIYCHTFNELVLEPIRSNPENFIIEELERRIDELVKKSPLIFQNKILECI